MPAFHDDLLEQARFLANGEKGRPKQASPRRAISTAYYALFHLLIHETVSNWRRSHQRQDLARAFEHGKMKDACHKERARLQKALPGLTGRQKRIAECLRIVTRTFVEMQQERHAADYDGARRWTRTEAEQRIGAVEAAFFNWKAIHTEPEAQDFLLSLFVKKR